MEQQMLTVSRCFFVYGVFQRSVVLCHRDCLREYEKTADVIERIGSIELVMLSKYNMALTGSVVRQRCETVYVNRRMRSTQLKRVSEDDVSWRLGYVLKIHNDH